MYKRVVYFPVQTTRAFSHWSSEWVEDKELISFRIYTIYTESQPVSPSPNSPPSLQLNGLSSKAEPVWKRGQICHSFLAQSFQISLESWNASCAIQKEHTSMCRLLTSLLAGASSLPPKPAPGTGKVWTGWVDADACKALLSSHPHATCTPHATHFKI